ncbi:MAG: hypothetical protein KIT20_09045 [Alphaproteobacteria bacterium]|nr:hypothetical protein [Alphaproteobacteria bacterium]
MRAWIRPAFLLACGLAAAAPLPAAAQMRPEKVCLEIGSSTFWRATVENYRITVLDNNRPTSEVWLRACTVRSTSQISFPKSTLCTGDPVMVDGRECLVSFVQPYLN